MQGVAIVALMFFAAMFFLIRMAGNKYAISREMIVNQL